MSAVCPSVSGLRIRGIATDAQCGSTYMFSPQHRDSSHIPNTSCSTALAARSPLVHSRLSRYMAAFRPLGESQSYIRITPSGTEIHIFLPRRYNKRGCRPTTCWPRRTIDNPNWEERTNTRNRTGVPGFLRLASVHDPRVASTLPFAPSRALPSSASRYLMTEL